MARGDSTVAVRDDEEDRGVTAAASPIGLDGTTWRSWKLGDTRWQMEAWRHFDICGELRFASNWMANAISRCRLYVAELDKFGRPGKEVPDEDIQLLAESMFGGPTLKAEAQRALGAQLYVTGESYIVAEDVTSSTKDAWYVCSTSEVHRRGNERILVDRSNLHGGGQHELRKGRDLMMRVWTPHPRRYDAADCSVRAVLPILREIEGLTKKVFAQIDSRLAGAGLLFLPQELSFPRTDKDPPGAAGLMALLQRNIAAALQDQSAASALVPVMAQVPGELIDKIKWQTFETPFQAETAEKLLNAVRRLATGLDIPPEVLLGQGDTNHWSAWQIEESTIKIQVEPMLVRICDALTNGYLKAALKVIGKDPDQFVVWYDTAALAVRPNRQADALALYGAEGGLGLISGDEVRKAGDWGDGAKPKKKEYEQRLAEKVIGLNPALIGNKDVQKALGIDWKIEDPAAAQPGMPMGEEAPAEDGWQREGATEERGLPQYPANGTPAQEAALLVGADGIVRRALERAGARLLTRARKASGEFTHVPAGRVYEHVECSPEQLGQLLGDAFLPAADLADRVGMDPDVVTDMITVYTTRLMALREPHDYSRFALYVDQALELIGHTGCAQFCRNPLHPGPCKGWRSGQTPTKDSGRKEPAAGPGKPRKAAKKAAPKAVAPDAAPAQAQRAPVVKGGSTAAADMDAAANGDAAAQQRIVAAAHEAYGYTDPDTGITAKVIEVAPDPQAAHGGGVRIAIRMYDQAGKQVGTATRTWGIPLGQDKIRVRHHTMVMERGVQGGGFSRRWNDQAKQGYEDMGVSSIRTLANDTVGGSAQASQGFDFAYEDDMTAMADRFRPIADRLPEGDPLKAEINDLIIRSTDHDFAAGTHPSPYEWYMVGRSEPFQRGIRGRMQSMTTWLGRNAMLGSEWEGVYPVTEPHRPQSREQGTTAAAEPEGRQELAEQELGGVDGAGWDERAEFLASVREADLAWADEIAQEVPSDPDFPDRPGKVNDYPEHHHLFSADEETQTRYLEDQGDVLDEWGRGLTASAHATFCRNPLHPGPCKKFRTPQRGAGRRDSVPDGGGEPKAKRAAPADPDKDPMMLPRGQRGDDGFPPAVEGQDLLSDREHPDRFIPSAKALKALVTKWQEMDYAYGDRALVSMKAGQEPPKPEPGELPPHNGSRNTAAAAVLQRFDAKPIVVDDENLDAIIELGGVELFRGVGAGTDVGGQEVSPHAIIDQIRSGDAYYGYGAYGNGIYAGTDADIAREYGAATRFPDDPAKAPGGPAKRNGALVRMALRPGSRVIDYTEAREARAEWTTEMLAVAADKRMDPDQRSEWRELVTKASQDLGTWAIMMGYDAIYADEAKHVRSAGDRSRHFTLLNRGALAISDQTEDIIRGTV